MTPQEFAESPLGTALTEKHGWGPPTWERVAEFWRTVNAARWRPTTGVTSPDHEERARRYRKGFESLLTDMGAAPSAVAVWRKKWHSQSLHPIQFHGELEWIGDLLSASIAMQGDALGIAMANQGE